MATSQVMEIKAKNVECLKALITVAQTDGNYLGEAWYDVSLRQIRMIIIINKISMRFS